LEHRPTDEDLSVHPSKPQAGLPKGAGAGPAATPTKRKT
jgi:hypothetical protein